MSIEDSIKHEREILLEEEKYLMEKINSKNYFHCFMAIIYRRKLDRLRASPTYKSYIDYCKKPPIEKMNSPLR